MNMNQEIIYGAASVVCTAIAAVHDLYDRRIPNLLTGGTVLVGITLHFFLGGWTQVAFSIAAGLIAGVLFLLFYLAGGMGGGDVKLMAGVGCIVGLGNLEQVVVSIVIIGAVCALVAALYKGVFRQTILNMGKIFQHHQTEGFRAHPEFNISNANAIRLPYGVPIAAGCLFTFCELAAKGIVR